MGERKGAVRAKRVYEPADPDDGYRVLVDRLWPRGLRKEEAHLDQWAKEVAPSSELRKWYGHEPSRFEEFARRYRQELEQPPANGVAVRLAALVSDRESPRPVTLLTATRDLDRSGAAVLRDHIRRLVG